MTQTPYSIRFDNTAQVYEAFSSDGEWIGAFDTRAEARERAERIERQMRREAVQARTNDW